MTKRERCRPPGQHGLTLVELVVVVGIIGILAAIAIPLYANIQARARIGKAQADVRTLASAVGAYQAHTGTVPPDFNTLTVAASNSQGQTAGPFMANVPSPPQGWSSSSGPAAQAVPKAQGNLSSSSGSGYGYATAANGVFTVSGAGDGVTVTAP